METENTQAAKEELIAALAVMAPEYTAQQHERAAEEIFDDMNRPERWDSGAL